MDMYSCVTVYRLRNGSSSLLCRPDAWSFVSEDHLAHLYDSELTAILDSLIPAQTSHIQPMV